MTHVSFPEVTATLRADTPTAGLTAERILFVGQMRTGSATSGQLQSNIGNSASDWNGLFGADSPIAYAIGRARRRNGQTRIDAIGLSDNGSGVAATGTVVAAGTATAAGTIRVIIGSKKFSSLSIAVTNGMTAAQFAMALNTAVTGMPNGLVTSGASTGTVTLTAKTAGTFGNTIGLKIEGVVAGLTVTCTAMTGGATDPVLTGVLDVVGRERYQGIVWQWGDTTVLRDFLDNRFNVTDDVLDGRGFVSITDTFSNHLTTLNALNSRSLCVNADKLINESTHRGPAVMEIPFVKVAEFAGTRALRRTDNAPLGDLVIARNPTDSRGGIHQNSKPYANTPFPDLLIPDAGDGFTQTEMAQLQAAGGWVIDSNRAGNSVIAGRVVTTYKTDAAGNPDPSFTALNFVDSATAAREFIVNNTRAQYSQYRAVAGALIPGVDSANEASVAAYVTQLNGDLADDAIVNTGVGTIGGEEVNFNELFRQNLTVTLNTVTGAFAVAARLYIVNQLTGITYDLAVDFEI